MYKCKIKQEGTRHGGAFTGKIGSTLVKAKWGSKCDCVNELLISFGWLGDS
ncbi:MAG: hypothetical protein R2786_08935 [Flavobacteriaceae bacterium]